MTDDERAWIENLIDKLDSDVLSEADWLDPHDRTRPIIAAALRERDAEWQAKLDALLVEVERLNKVIASFRELYVDVEAANLRRLYEPAVEETEVQGNQDQQAL